MSVNPLTAFVNVALPSLVSSFPPPPILSNADQAMTDSFTSQPIPSNANSHSLTTQINTLSKRKLNDNSYSQTKIKVKKTFHKTTHSAFNHPPKTAAARVLNQGISSTNRLNHSNIPVDALEKKEPCNDTPLSSQSESRYSGPLSTYFSIRDVFKIEITETTSHLPKILQSEGDVNRFWMLLKDQNVLNGKCELILQDPTRGNPKLEIEVKNGLPVLIKGQISTTHATYVGEFSMDQKEFVITGKGELTCKDGLSESGYWERGGLRTGRSTYKSHQLPLGITFLGEVVDYFWQEGTEVRFPSGDRFQGKVLSNGHFIGKVVTVEGRILHGEFSKEWQLINGSHSYDGVRPPSKPVFIGKYVHGKITMKDSLVEILYPNGAILTGIFSSGCISGKDILQGRLESPLGVPGYSFTGKFVLESDSYFPTLIQGKAVYENNKPSRILMVGEVDYEGKTVMNAILPDGEQIPVQHLEPKQWIGQRKNGSNKGQRGHVDANGRLQGKWVKINESHQGNSALDGFFENDQLIEGIKIGLDGTQYKVSIEKLEA